MNFSELAEVERKKLELRRVKQNSSAIFFFVTPVGAYLNNDFMCIFFLTSFFNPSIHCLIATEHRCNTFHAEWKGE